MRCENCGNQGPCPWRLLQASGALWRPIRNYFPDADPRAYLIVCNGCATTCRDNRLFVVVAAEFSNLRELIFGKEE